MCQTWYLHRVTIIIYKINNYLDNYISIIFKNKSLRVLGTYGSICTMFEYNS